MTTPPQYVIRRAIFTPTWRGAALLYAHVHWLRECARAIVHTRVGGWCVWRGVIVASCMAHARTFLINQSFPSARVNPPRERPPAARFNTIARCVVAFHFPGVYTTPWPGRSSFARELPYNYSRCFVRDVSFAMRRFFIPFADRNGSSLRCDKIWYGIFSNLPLIYTFKMRSRHHNSVNHFFTIDDKFVERFAARTKNDNASTIKR